MRILHVFGIFSAALFFCIGTVEGKEKNALTDPSMTQLPISSTAYGAPTVTTTIIVRKSDILLNRKKVCEHKNSVIEASLKKNKNPLSYMIMPVFFRLKEAAEKRKKFARYNSAMKFKGVLSLRMHRHTSYRLLTELMFTAGKAGFKIFRFVVCSKKTKGGRCARVGVIEITDPGTKKSCGPGFLSKAEEAKVKKAAKRSAMRRKLAKNKLLQMLGRKTPTALRASGKKSGPAKLRKPVQKKKVRPRSRASKPAQNHRSKPAVSPAVLLQKGGFAVIVRGSRLTAACKVGVHSSNQQVTIPNKGGKNDFAGLSACIGKIKAQFPKSKRAVILAPPKVQYQTLIHIMDAIRGTSKGVLRYPCLFLSVGII